MTFFRASFGIITRSNGGSALRRSAYQRCANDGPGFNFASKAAELVSHGIMHPAGSSEFSSPQALWEAAEAMEKRVDSQLARTLEIAIPHAVPHELRDQFADHMLRWLADDHGFAVEWSRHSTPHVFNDTGSDTENDHIHALVSLRKLGPDGFDRLKDRDFNSLMRKRNGREMRESIATRMNEFFDRHGIAAKVTADPKSDDELRIEEAPKQIIQQLKRYQNAKNKGLPAPKVGHRTKDFIRARHSRKNAIAAVTAANREASAFKEKADPAGLAAGGSQRPVGRDRQHVQDDPANDTGSRPTSNGRGESAGADAASNGVGSRNRAGPERPDRGADRSREQPDKRGEPPNSYDSGRLLSGSKELISSIQRNTAWGMYAPQITSLDVKAASSFPALNRVEPRRTPMRAALRRGLSAGVGGPSRPHNDGHVMGGADQKTGLVLDPSVWGPSGP